MTRASGDVLIPQPAPIASYLATDYVVIDGGKEITVRIGESSRDLDALLEAHSARHGVFITAHNPRSEPQPDSVNQIANDAIRRIFAERGLVTLPHIGRSPDGDWIEHGFFVLELARSDALSLAAEFEQFAIVLTERGKPAELLLTALGQQSA
jgi:Protein of unknown function (DUF3293)